MLNFQDIEDSLPLHFVKVVKRVRDVAMFVADVPDMGMGVTGFEFAIPEGRTVDELVDTFKTSREIRRIATPVARFTEEDSLRYPQTARRSVEHLGEHNSYFGLYHCGRYERDLYLLLVSSYDVQSATKFRDRIAKQVRSTFEHVNDEKTFKKIERYRVRNSDIMETEEYLQAIYRGNVNRRAIAAKVFSELGIPYTEEMERFGQSGGQDVITIPRHSAKFDFSTVFLQRHGDYARLFYHAYSHADFHAGAPWFLAPHRGFYSFVQPPVQSEEFQNFFHSTQSNGDFNVYRPSGFPTGNPRKFVDTNDPVDTELQNQVERKVLWISDMNIMMHANPQLFQSVDDHSCPELIQTYNLQATQLTLWRTLAMYVSPPDPESLDIRVSVKFATSAYVRLGFETYREINHMWTTMIAYETDFAADAPSIIFSKRTTTEKQKWSRSMLPCMADLYARQSDDLLTTDFSVEMLHCLIQAFDQADAYIHAKTGVVETISRQEESHPLQNAIHAMFISDFSDADPGAAPTNDLPLDETDRDRPARAVNYSAHPLHRDDLGEPPVSTTSGASDSDAGERFRQYQESRSRTVAAQNKKTGKESRSSSRGDGRESSSDRRRRKQTRALATARSPPAAFYPHGTDYNSFTSEDDTIRHKS